MKFNQNYSSVFGREPDAMKAIEKSENEPSLEYLIQQWLERTPGLEASGFDFWSKYKAAVNEWLDSMKESAQVSGLCDTSMGS